MKDSLKHVLRQVWHIIDRFWLGHGRTRRGRMIIVTILLLIGFVSAGVKWATNQISHTTSDPVSQVSITTREDFADVCNGKKMTQAQAYKTGSAPYGAAVLQQTSSNSYLAIPDASLILNPNVGPSLRMTASQVQIVACVTRTSSAATGSNCAYNTATLPLYDASYHLSIYSAADHQQLVSRAISSTPYTSASSAGSGCPAQATYNTHNPRLYNPPDYAQIIDALQPLVQP